MRRTCTQIIATLLGLTLVVISSVVPALGAEKVKITVPAPSTAFAPLYHAQSAGYFTDEGLEAEITVAPAQRAFRRFWRGMHSSPSRRAHTSS